MKTFHLILTALLVSSCASFSSTEKTPITQRIQFSGARSDLFPMQRQAPQTLTERLLHESGVRLFLFPLTYAVECNTTKTYCKHAVVKTQLEFTAQVMNEHTIKLSGVLRSEMGRSLSTSSPPSPAYSQTLSMSVPSEVEIIGESKDNQRFDRVLQLGEKLELKGLAGVQVILEFQ